jgi:hypothetical protein
VSKEILEVERLVILNALKHERSSLVYPIIGYCRTHIIDLRRL